MKKLIMALTLGACVTVPKVYLEYEVHCKPGYSVPKCSYPNYDTGPDSSVAWTYLEENCSDEWQKVKDRTFDYIAVRFKDLTPNRVDATETSLVGCVGYRSK